MTLLRPELWPLLLLAPALFLLLRRLDRRRSRILAAAAGPRTPVARVARRMRHALLAAAFAAALLAALEPAWGESVRAGERPAAEVIVCLDVSRSMLARDLAPSRLARAKEMVQGWLREAEGDRVGLVLFAGSARLAVPLTADRASLGRMVELADPFSLAQGGSDLGGALARSLEAIEGGAGGAPSILLLTDGEDHAGEGLAAAARCRERGVVVHCIAFGSERGAKIPIEGEGGERFLRDAEGREVITSMRPASLRALAEAAQGTFRTAGEGMIPLAELRAGTIRRGESRRNLAHRYQWPLSLAFGLFVLERLLRRRP